MHSPHLCTKEEAPPVTDDDKDDRSDSIRKSIITHHEKDKSFMLKMIRFEIFNSLGRNMKNQLEDNLSKQKDTHVLQSILSIPLVNRDQNQQLRLQKIIS